MQLFRKTLPSAHSVSRRLIVVLGPTTSGKSSLGVQLAKKYRGVVISADSRQVYRGLDLGTGKIKPTEMRGVPHFLLDIASPHGQYSVARYVRDVRQVTRRLPPATPLFLVGGSPFYIDALTKPDKIMSVPPNPKLRRRLEAKTTPQLVAMLRRLAPERYKIIDRANRRRLIRAIEIASVKTSLGDMPTLPDWQVLKIGIRVPNKKLFPRIDRRVDQRLRTGMMNEVRRLHRHGLNWKKLDAFGLEYRFLSRYLRGELPKAEAVSQLKTAIHNFARRQMTWWRRDTEINWVISLAQADRLVKKFLA